jgi:hypothetical protein
MQLTTTLLLLASALSVSAHPSAAHRHAHRQLDTKALEQIIERAIGVQQTAPIEARGFSFKKVGRPKTKTTAAAPAATPATPTPAAAAPSSGNVLTSGVVAPFCGGAKSKRATAAQIAYKGNTGVAGNWGCNMMMVDGSVADKYDYSAKFTTTGSTFTCACFNKIGPTGLIDGFWHTAVSFTVNAGETKYMAFDTNSQGGCACGSGGTVPKTPLGQFAGVWLEFDWGNESNGGNSGADVSVLVAGASSMPFYGMAVTDPLGKVCSSVESNGHNFAAYMPGDEALDGVGCKGYYKGQLKVVLGDP